MIIDATLQVHIDIHLCVWLATLLRIFRPGPALATVLSMFVFGMFWLGLGAHSFGTER